MCRWASHDEPLESRVAEFCGLLCGPRVHPRHPVRDLQRPRRRPPRQGDLLQLQRGWWSRDGTHAVSIVDVTDKSNPVSLARMQYANFGYSHQGWLTNDQRYFLHGDELDEVIHGIGTTTRVWDVRDLDNPTVANVFENTTTSIDHNLYTEGRSAYASNYTSGLRVYDIRKIPAITERLFFDVYPENDNASFEGGTWSNYGFYNRNRIVTVSSIDRGLFILRTRG